jgi:glycosyltransferase involved in cell wall biosynthesis
MQDRTNLIAGCPNDDTEHCRGPARSIAVMIPCYNEEIAIAQTVRDFGSALPSATIYVYDNNSVDRTVEEARRAGAVVRSEPLKGKGNVVRRMFADVEADVYVVVDGDGTYHAASAPAMVQTLLNNQLDMVNGRRVAEVETAYRPGHRFGNMLLTSIVKAIFGKQFNDMLSGYRVLSRRFVKTFPALSSEFELETELTVHALELRMPTAEVETPYRGRPKGGVSKLRTYRDAWRILATIMILVKEERPFQLFGTIFGLLTVISLTISVPLMIVYLRTGLVPRLPTVVLTTGLMLLGFLSLFAGLILDTVTLGRREAKRMHYLSICALPPGGFKQ